MKTIVKYVLVSTLFLAFASCEEADELTEFDVSDTFNASWDVNVTEPVTEPQEVTYSDTIDITENADILDNYGDLESLVIHEFYIEIKDFDGNEDAVIDNTTVTINDLVIDLGTINPYSADSADQLIQIGNSQQIAAVASMLMNSSTIDMTFSGMMDNTPATFTVEGTLSLTATFDVL